MVASYCTATPRLDCLRPLQLRNQTDGLRPLNPRHQAWIGVEVNGGVTLHGDVETHGGFSVYSDFENAMVQAITSAEPN